jgi:hypothetical protein
VFYDRASSSVPLSRAGADCYLYYAFMDGNMYIYKTFGISGPFTNSRHRLLHRSLVTAVMWYHFRVSTLYNGKHAVAQLVEALRYKPEGSGFDSRWCHCNFALT